ncbi:rhodanese-related sulfurtransferase [Candidatus Woesearchaeota archaeon]|nr:rhodanese-related sulfurtransferase [Candidatus Woesearchaeota archaeon]
MEKIIVLLYYKYVKIDNPEAFRAEHLKILNNFNLKGRVLVAEEGINGAVSGTKESTEQYKRYMHSIPGFSDVHFKETEAKSHPFRKTQVKIKKEIVASGLYGKVDVNDAGIHLEPAEFRKMIEENEDAVVLDMRNDYEYKVGRFKGAVQIGTENFREFTRKVSHFDEFKGRNILMYCTGGVRCEKASAYFRQKGFKNVFQLKGGIMNY